MTTHADETAAQSDPPATAAPAEPTTDEQSDTGHPGDIPFDQAAAEHENPALG